MDDSDFSNKKLQDKDKICHICEKSGHNQYNCKARESVKGQGRIYLDPKYNEQPHLLNTFAMGVPTNIDLNEFGKTIMEPMKISQSYYEISRTRDDKVHISFADEASKEKFIKHFSFYPTCCYQESPLHLGYYQNTAKRPLKCKLGNEDFSVVFRDEHRAEIEDIFARVQKLRTKYSIEVKFERNKGLQVVGVYVRRKQYYWILKAKEDVRRLRKTFEIMDQEPLKSFGKTDGKTTFLRDFLV